MLLARYLVRAYPFPLKEITKKSVVIAVKLIVDKHFILQCRFLVSGKYAAIPVFGAAVVMRAIPEALTYPQPTWHDVVNYYIPVLENLPQHWPLIADEFLFISGRYNRGYSPVVHNTCI